MTIQIKKDFFYNYLHIIRDSIINPNIKFIYLQFFFTKILEVFMVKTENGLRLRKIRLIYIFFHLSYVL